MQIDRPFITTYVSDTGNAFVNCSWKPLFPSADVEFVITWYDADVYGTLQPILLGPALKLGADVFAGTTVRHITITHCPIQSLNHPGPEPPTYL